MTIQIGAAPDHDFDEPLGLLGDCHRRMEHFADVLIVTEDQAAGGPLTSAPRGDFEASVSYFVVAGPKHTAEEEQSLFPRLRRKRPGKRRTPLSESSGITMRPSSVTPLLTKRGCLG